MGDKKIPLRRMSLFDLTAAGATFIAPAFSLAAVFFFIDLQGGSYAPIGVALGSLAALLVALSFAMMSKHYPKAGGAYAIVQGELSKEAGFVAGWGLAILYFLGPAIPLFLVVTTVLLLLPSLAFALIPLTIIVAALVFAVNAIGLRPSTRVGFLFFLTEAAILVAIAVILFTRPAVPTSAPSGTFGAMSAIGFSAIWTVFLFLGFDSVTTYSEEAKVPLKDISRGTVLALAITAVIYIVSTLAYIRAVPQSTWALAMPGTLSPLQDAIGPSGSFLVAIVIVTSSMGALIAVENSCARLFFAMGRDRILPPILARLVGWENTPGITLGLSAVVTGGLVFWWGITGAGFSTPSFWFIIGLLPVMLVLGALLAYFLVSLAALKRMIELGERLKAMVPLGGIFVTGALLVFQLLPTNPLRIPAVVGVALWFIAGLALWGLSKVLLSEPSQVAGEGPGTGDVSQS